MEKYGYIQIEFNKKTKKLLQEWSNKNIDHNDLMFCEINGEKIGGIVVKDAHMTICYGIPADSHFLEIRKEIKKINLPAIKVRGIDFFDIKEYNTKILYFLIDDSKKILKSLNKSLQKFVSKDLKDKKDFVPHVTIAYMSNKFNIKKLKDKRFPELSPTGIKFYKE